MKIYLAGPDVFYPDALYIGKRKQQLCENQGAIGLFPLDNAVDLREPDAAYTIFLSNKALMDDADCCIANLTPFRGPSADVGTVLEMGYMIGQGKPVFGYSNDNRHYIKRVLYGGYGGKRSSSHDDNRWIDRQEALIEDFGLHDNIMIDCSIRHQGFSMIVPDVNHDMSLYTFERCLKSCVDNMNFRKRMP